MACPHLKEVVMLYCDAFPVKKMVPLAKLVSADPCLTCNFERCPIYLQQVASAQAGAASAEPPLHGVLRRES